MVCRDNFIDNLIEVKEANGLKINESTILHYDKFRFTFDMARQCRVERPINEGKAVTDKDGSKDIEIQSIKQSKVVKDNKPRGGNHRFIKRRQNKVNLSLMSLKGVTAPK